MRVHSTKIPTCLFPANGFKIGWKLIPQSRISNFHYWITFWRKNDEKKWSKIPWQGIEWNRRHKNIWIIIYWTNAQVQLLRDELWQKMRATSHVPLRIRNKSKCSDTISNFHALINNIRAINMQMNVKACKHSPVLPVWILASAPWSLCIPDMDLRCFSSCFIFLPITDIDVVFSLFSFISEIFEKSFSLAFCMIELVTYAHNPETSSPKRHSQSRHKCTSRRGKGNGIHVLYFHLNLYVFCGKANGTYFCYTNTWICGLINLCILEKLLSKAMLGLAVSVQ